MELLFCYFMCGLSGLLSTLLIGACYGPAALGAFNIVYAFYIILSQVAAFGVHHSVLKHKDNFQNGEQIIAFRLSNTVLCEKSTCC